MGKVEAFRDINDLRVLMPRTRHSIYAKARQEMRKFGLDAPINLVANLVSPRTHSLDELEVLNMPGLWALASAAITIIYAIYNSEARREKAFRTVPHGSAATSDDVLELVHPCTSALISLGDCPQPSCRVN